MSKSLKDEMRDLTRVAVLHKNSQMNLPNDDDGFPSLGLTVGTDLNANGEWRVILADGYFVAEGTTVQERCLVHEFTAHEARILGHALLQAASNAEA